MLAFVAVGGLLWWWWSAPPAWPADRLAIAAAVASADADGIVILAEPRRAARWLALHRSALLPLALVDPGAVDAIEKHRATLQAVLAAARGPVVLWWLAEHVAFATEVDDGARAALDQLAALQSLASARRGGAYALATSSDALGPPANAAPIANHGSVSALACVRGRWWRVEARRDRLLAHSGVVPGLPERTGRSSIRTQDAGALLTPLDVSFLTARTPVCMLLGSAGAWGVRLPTSHLSADATGLLGLDRRQHPNGVSAPTRVTGVLGPLWLTEHPELAAASSRELLEAVLATACGDEAGILQSADVVSFGDYLIGSPLAKLAGRRVAQRWRASRPLLVELESVRWRLNADGGVLVVEW
jgi:hypothetical protein